MICQVFGHKAIDVIKADGTPDILCTRCNLTQGEWPKRSPAIDGFLRGLWQAVGLGALALFGGILAGQDAMTIAGYTGLAFFGALTGRTVEGAYDARKGG